MLIVIYAVRKIWVRINFWTIIIKIISAIYESIISLLAKSTKNYSKFEPRFPLTSNKSSFLQCTNNDYYHPLARVQDQ